MAWENQWGRAQRSFGEFKKTNDGRVHDRNSDYYLDEAIHFFEDCYHLKDWLKNDSISKPLVTDVEGVISGSPNLSLCADLANGAKHLTLTSTRTGDRTTGFGNKLVKLGLGAGVPTTVAVSYEVKSGGITYDAFTVAAACMAEWDAYLRTKALIP